MVEQVKSRGDRPATIALMVFAVLVLGLVAYSVRHVRAEVVEVTSSSSALRVQPLSRQQQPVMVVLGDSFTAGSPMNDGPTWPDIIAGKRGIVCYKEAIGGSGYVNNNPTIPHTSFLDRVDVLRDYRPDLLILAGGINDGDQPLDEVKANAEKVATAARKDEPHAKIVMLSPFASGGPTSELLAIADALKAIAAQHHFVYVDATRFLPESLVGSDGIHPVEAGHRLLAKRIGAALVADHVFPLKQRPAQ